MEDFSISKANLIPKPTTHNHELQVTQPTTQNQQPKTIINVFFAFSFAVIKNFSNFANANSFVSPPLWHEVANEEWCATYKEVFAERFGFDCFERRKFIPQDKGIAGVDTTG